MAVPVPNVWRARCAGTTLGTLAGAWGGTSLAKSSVLWQLGSRRSGIQPMCFFGVGLVLASGLEVWS